MELKLYSTLTRQLESFNHDKDTPVKLYTCGPTVYNFAHIGNLRTYIFEDVLRRTLESLSYQVDHVMNITDVGHLTSDADEGEDKLEKGAVREGKTVWDVAKYYTDAFFNDTDRLNIERPTHVAPATFFIDKQIAMITLLADKGFTYQTEQAVYFDTSKLEDYGKLTGQKLEEKQTARQDIVQDSGKKHQADFALWFFLYGHYKNHTMHWSSPWGEGFPGWHIECAAINWQFFPDGTDIHTGGIDHIPVHHTNEIAQYEAALSQQMAKIWLHGNFLVLKDSEKMAKSGENFLTLKSLIDRGFDPLAYRYFVLGAHYRSELQFSWEALTAAQNALDSLSATVRTWTTIPAKNPLDDITDVFFEALADDLNTPRALGILWDVVNQDYDVNEQVYAMRLFDRVLGLGLTDLIGKPLPRLSEKHPIFANSEQSKQKALKAVGLLTLLEHRIEARAADNYGEADKDREKVESLGFSIDDTAMGTVVASKIKI